MRLVFGMVAMSLPFKKHPKTSLTILFTYPLYSSDPNTYWKFKLVP